MEIDKDKSIVLTKTILFSLGFSFVFITLGAAASAIGNVLLFFSNELRIVAGLIIIIFSLQMLGFLNFSFLNTEKRIQTNSNYKDNYAFPFIVGAAFAFGWTPCIGPVLGSRGFCIWLDTMYWSSFGIYNCFVCHWGYN